MLDKGPLAEIYNTIFDTIHRKYVTKKYGYAKTESSQLSTMIWSIALDWEALLKKEKNAKHLLTGMTIHRLTRRNKVVQMLNKLNSCPSYNETGLQIKSWDCMIVSSKPISNHKCKGIPFHAKIDNSYEVQETLREKSTTHDMNMTLFQTICEGLFWSLFENLILVFVFNVFEVRVKRTVCSIVIF